MIVCRSLFLFYNFYEIRNTYIVALSNLTTIEVGKIALLKYFFRQNFVDAIRY